MPGPGGELDRREREILRALVQDYIQTGEPVASQPLLARHDLDVLAGDRPQRDGRPRGARLPREAARLLRAHPHRARATGSSSTRSSRSGRRRRRTASASSGSPPRRATSARCSRGPPTSSTRCRTTPASSRRRARRPTPSATSSSCACARTACSRSSSRQAGIVTNKLVQLEFPMEPARARARRELPEREDPARRRARPRASPTCASGSSPTCAPTRARSRDLLQKALAPRRADLRRRVPRPSACSPTARRASSTRPSSPTCRRRGRCSGPSPRRTGSCGCSTACSPRRRCRSSSARRASSPRCPTSRWWRRRTAAATGCSARSRWSARPA